MEDNKFSSFGQCPMKLVLDREVTSTSIRVMLIIHGLTQEEGFCWASNKYLGEKLGLSEPTITRAITLLRKKLYIISEMITKDRITYRKLYINYTFSNTCNQKRLDPLIKNDDTPSSKMINNIDKNKIDKNNKILPESEDSESLISNKIKSKKGTIKNTLHVELNTYFYEKEGIIINGQESKSIERLIEMAHKTCTLQKLEHTHDNLKESIKNKMRGFKKNNFYKNLKMSPSLLLNSWNKLKSETIEVKEKFEKTNGFWIEPKGKINLEDYLIFGDSNLEKYQDDLKTKGD